MNSSGDDLLSRAVTRQVSSAQRSLTTVFGMGTGVTFSLLPPNIVETKSAIFRFDQNRQNIHTLPCFSSSQKISHSFNFSGALLKTFAWPQPLYLPLLFRSAFVPTDFVKHLLYSKTFRLLNPFFAFKNRIEESKQITYLHNFCLFRSSPRPISIGQLNMLPCLHLRPINHIVYVGSY